MEVDYSLYLVTDSTPDILGDRDLVSVVKEAIEGGVTVVQLREKNKDTGDFVSIAKKLRRVTKEHGIPLIINDRVDVALASEADGVHVGQDDMDVVTARSLVGKDMIIGATVSSKEEAIKAVEDGADYLGIGTIFATQTKEDSKSIIGPTGLRDILVSISSLKRQVPTVCIGGINHGNLQKVLYQSTTPLKTLSGVAVVSAIIGSSNPKEAASDLRNLVSQPPQFIKARRGPAPKNLAELKHAVPALHQKLVKTKPLCHNMTNLVVQNFSANVALSIGGSPIMSNNPGEASDLAKLGGSLVINMGTVAPDGIKAYVEALNAYNDEGGPVLFDPVGGGATSLRRAGVRELLSSGYFSCLKGNESEIQALHGAVDVVQRGVDSSGSMSEHDKAALVKDLAQRERTVVFMTGAIDYLSDGSRIAAISNGHEYLGNITGSGCSLGTTVAAFLAVERDDMFLAALAGLLVFEIAAERAAVRPEVRGPGTFVPAFLDELYILSQESLAENFNWIQGAKVEFMDV